MDKAAEEAEGLQDHQVTIHKIDFHHPYTPYDIQETFMSTVYQVLEDGKVGILESPTGTGKSLSLICGSLTWLRDHKRKTFEEGLDWGPNDSNSPEWLIEQTRARKRREMLRSREDMEARLAKIRLKEKAQKDRYLKGDHKVKKRKTDAETSGKDGGEDQFVLDDYDSDQEQHSTKDEGSLYSAKTLELMEQLGMGSIAKEEEEEVEEETKIFYCSRTHSQLTQFINELRRVNFPPAFPEEKPSKEPQMEDLKHLTLGSRKNLCINPKVNNLGSVAAINERCSELQQSSTAKEHKCVFLPNKENQPLVNTFRDHALATLRDIEDLGALGKEIGVCPYYASRAAIKPAEIVTLPYPLLLQKSAREALGISLKGHVVIIDEAHNLMDAISSIHGVEISLKQLKAARAQLGVYLQKFRNRLKGKNRVYIAQVVRVIDSLAGYLEGRLALPQTDGIVLEKELLAGKGVDQINFFKLIRYLQESKLARKVEGYATHTAETSTSISAQNNKKNISSQPKPKPDSTTPVLHHITSLLSVLTHPSKEGQLFFSKPTSSPTTTQEPISITLKYQLLDPSPHFHDIVSSARAVILAGGTMSPMHDYTTHLFPYLPSSSLTTLSSGHVIPRQNLIAWNLSRGPSGQALEFTFKNRGNTQMVDDLGRALLNLCTVVPDGVVVFFHPTVISLPSSLNETSKSQTLYARLAAKKPIFTESKDRPVEETLAAYTQSIDTNHGGLLLSVVGGKMSEGINFSDRLGRLVVIVGLPFPNIMSAEWKAKMAYVESSTIAQLELENQENQERENQQAQKGIEKATKNMTRNEIHTLAKAQGRELYENACMRAVNQSIGRAIRHRGDYAAIVMVDARFEGERIRGKLPGWIREGLVDDAGRK
ncbi:ATP-dependent DNA helicase, partial [Lachnellula subtilissima]